MNVEEKLREAEMIPACISADNNNQPPFRLAMKLVLMDGTQLRIITVTGLLAYYYFDGKLAKQFINSQQYLMHGKQENTGHNEWDYVVSTEHLELPCTWRNTTRNIEHITRHGATGPHQP